MRTKRKDDRSVRHLEQQILDALPASLGGRADDTAIRNTAAAKAIALLRKRPCECRPDASCQRCDAIRTWLDIAKG